MFATKVLVVLVALIAVASCNPFGKEPLQRLRIERSAPTDGSVEICGETSPCGWAVYEQFTRNIEYYMRNVCDCPKGKKCSKSSDDLSVKAYVYRCYDPTQKS